MVKPSNEEVELDLLRLLEATPHVSQRSVASRLGLSVGLVNYCLKALVDKGLVKAENYRNSTNKVAYFYLLTPSGIATKARLTRQFLVRKKREYEALRLEIERLQHESDPSGSAG